MVASHDDPTCMYVCTYVSKVHVPEHHLVSAGGQPEESFRPDNVRPIVVRYGRLYVGEESSEGERGEKT
jgi:hypothetical protein